MRFSTRPVKLAAAALVAGPLAVAAAAVARADLPAGRPAPSRLDVENDQKYVEHLRSERKSLAEVKDMLQKEDISDRGGHRKDAVDHIDRALEAINAEIAEYDKDLKNGKGIH